MQVGKQDNVCQGWLRADQAGSQQQVVVQRKQLVLRDLSQGRVSAGQEFRHLLEVIPICAHILGKTHDTTLALRSIFVWEMKSLTPTFV